MGAYDCDCINNLEYDRRERKAQLSQEGTTSDAISRQEELLDDGTLVVWTNFDMTKFSRVNVRQIGTHYGDLFYPDEE